MANSPTRMLAGCVALALLGPIVGCAQPGPITSRRATQGTLKASVSRLEFENEGLRKQLADLKADNRRVENQLVQERDANGEITAQLDDARELIRRQGGDASALGAGTKAASFDEGIPPPATSAPVRRSRSSRKPPTTQIPRIDPADTEEPPVRDPGPQSRLDDESTWLPVARGLGRPVR